MFLSIHSYVQADAKDFVTVKRGPDTIAASKGLTPQMQKGEMIKFLLHFTALSYKAKILVVQSPSGQLNLLVRKQGP